MRSNPRTRWRWAAPLALVTLLGCAAEPAREAAPAAVSETLEPPFTAEQIRGEWTPGLTIVFHFLFPDRQEWQRWTVVDADAESAVILYQSLDAEGQPVAPPEQGSSRWTELRDHALFPAAGARRQRATRKTPLGTYEGWLYEVRDSQAEMSSSYFFADDLPGAPLWMEQRRGEQLVLSLSQIARQHLAAPPADDPETAPVPD